MTLEEIELKIKKIERGIDMLNGERGTQYSEVLWIAFDALITLRGKIKSESKKEVEHNTKPSWLKDDVVEKVAQLWHEPNMDNSNPRVNAVRMVQECAKADGYDININKGLEIIKEFCLKTATA